MSADPRAFAEILGLEAPLEVADIAPRTSPRTPPYRGLLDAGLGAA